jgi:YD repeat-containing protein
VPVSWLANLVAALILLLSPDASPPVEPVTMMSAEPIPMMPVDTYTGAASYQRVDLASPGSDAGLRLVRHYDTLSVRGGPLGPGWTHNYAMEVRAIPGSDDLALAVENGRRYRFRARNLFEWISPEGMEITLKRASTGGYRAQLADGRVWAFTPSGHLWWIEDGRVGPHTFLASSAAGVTAVKAPSDRGTLTFEYDHSSGRLAAVSDSRTPPRAVRYGYDARGRLETVTDPEGATTRYAYEGASHRLVRVTRPDGRTQLTMTYDELGRVKTQRDIRRIVPGPPTTFEYRRNPDGSGITSITTRGLDGTWSGVNEHHYDADEQLVRRIYKPSPDPDTWEVEEAAGPD